MKIIHKGFIYESINNNQSLTKYLQKYKIKIAELAQNEYDEWVGTIEAGHAEGIYYGGGICHLIADKIIDLLNNDNLLDARSISYSHEVHVATLVRWRDDENSNENFQVCTVDIPWHIYETGGGYSFDPLPNVNITSDDVTFYEQPMSIEDWEYDY